MIGGRLSKARWRFNLFGAAGDDVD